MTIGMGAYVLRRVGQMIPTLLGVVLITFILFHVVGGSPAAMVLGERASALALEEFDEARGFNKPLIAGFWGPTRLIAPGPPRWLDARGEAVPASDHGLRLTPGVYRLATAFPPRPGAIYRLELSWRGEPGTRAEWRAGTSVQPLEINQADVSKVWKTAGIRLATPASAGAASPIELIVQRGGLEVRAVRAQRRVRHLFDSQFVHYLARTLRGDLGVSSRENRRVAELLREGIGPTLALTVPIFSVGLITALALALLCAWRRNTWLDRMILWVAIGLMSVNYLVWIAVGQYLLAYRLGWFPAWGFDSPAHLVLPVLIGILCGLGADVRLYRALALEEVGRDYVRTAFSRGASAARVLLRHVLPNLMVPVLTNVVIALPFLYTGSLLLESFFGIPGLGYLGVNAIHSADVDVLRAVVLIGSMLFMIANLLTDIAYAALDPRIRLR